MKIHEHIYYQFSQTLVCEQFHLVYQLISQELAQIKSFLPEIFCCTETFLLKDHYASVYCLPFPTQRNNKSHFIFPGKEFSYFKCKQRRVIKKQFIFWINSFIVFGTRFYLFNVFKHSAWKLLCKKKLIFGILGIFFIKIHEWQFLN